MNHFTPWCVDSWESIIIIMLSKAQLTVLEQSMPKHLSILSSIQARLSQKLKSLMQTYEVSCPLVLSNQVDQLWEISGGFLPFLRHKLKFLQWMHVVSETPVYNRSRHVVNSTAWMCGDLQELTTFFRIFPVEGFFTVYTPFP